MHLQQFCSQLCLAHHVAISSILLLLPQKQLGQPTGQLPPQVLAILAAKVTSTQRVSRIFIYLLFINNTISKRISVIKLFAYQLLETIFTILNYLTIAQEAVTVR
jgi:hypothetical protein